MNRLIALIAAHKAMAAGLGSPVAFWIYSSAIQSLPVPKPDERWYGALYDFLHRVGANPLLVGQRK